MGSLGSSKIVMQDQLLKMPIKAERFEVVGRTVTHSHTLKGTLHQPTNVSLLPTILVASSLVKCLSK